MRTVLLCTDPVLRQTAKPVQVDASLQPLLKDMVQVMRDEEGIGLAAPQMGISKQILVIELPDEEPRFFINPTVYWSSEEKSAFEEGCLSVPGFRESVDRPAEIKLTYQDEHGTHHDIHATDLLARVLQHEIDHLKGKLYIDYLSPLKRAMILKKIKKEERLRTAEAEPASS